MLTKTQEKAVQLLNSGDVQSQLVLAQVFAKMTQDQIIVAIFHHMKYYLNELKQYTEQDNKHIVKSMRVHNAYDMRMELAYYNEDGFEFMLKCWISRNIFPLERFALRLVFNTEQDIKVLRPIADRESPTGMIDFIIKTPLN